MGYMPTSILTEVGVLKFMEASSVQLICIQGRQRKQAVDRKVGTSDRRLKTGFIYGKVCPFFCR